MGYSEEDEKLITENGTISSILAPKYARMTKIGT